MGLARRDSISGEMNDELLNDGARWSAVGATGWDWLEADRQQMQYARHHSNGKLKGRHY